MTDLTIERLAGYAGETVFDRGQRYFRSGRVLSWTADGGALRGRVKGSDQYPYRVEIDLRPAKPIARCTCPFDMGMWCKHAVAVAISYCLNGASRQPRPQGQRAERSNGNGRSAAPARERAAPEEAEGDEAGSRQIGRAHV